MINREDIVTVACFLWGRWCTPYGVEYVRRLFRAVASHSSTPHRFVCFTDKTEEVFPAGVEVVKIDLNYRWNLKKIYAYNRYNGLTGQVFLIDLDVVIVGNLDRIFSYRGKFVTCKGAYCNKAGGSFTSFPAGCWHDRLWLNLINNKEAIEDMTDGSERIYYRMTMRDRAQYWEDIMPGKILSYKRDCRQNGLPMNGERIVRFHGRPRPHEVKANWVREHWGG